MKNRIYISLIFTLLLALVQQISFAAPQGGTDIAVLGMGVGARPLGMGGAFTAIADNADAPYWNPAGLANITSGEITAMQTKLSEDTDHYYVSYVSPALGGTIGLSWIQIGTGNIVQTSSEVNSYNEVTDLGVFSYFSNAYLLSYGRKLNDKVSFGVTAKYLASDMDTIAGAQAYGYSITPGILISLRRSTDEADGREIRLAVKADDLLNGQKWGTGTEERSPMTLTLGLAVISQNPGTFAVDISQIMQSGYSATASLGYEWSQDGLSLRMGLNDGSLTAGAGFESGHARIDYAYVASSAMSKDNVHRISMTGKW